MPQWPVSLFEMQPRRDWTSLIYVLQSPKPTTEKGLGAAQPVFECLYSFIILCTQIRRTLFFHFDELKMNFYITWTNTIKCKRIGGKKMAIQCIIYILYLQWYKTFKSKSSRRGYKELASWGGGGGSSNQVAAECPQLALRGCWQTSHDLIGPKNNNKHACLNWRFSI